MTQLGRALTTFSLVSLLEMSALAQPAEDIQMPVVVPVAVPCDEPAAPCAAPVTGPAVRQRIPWQRSLSLGLASGVAAGAVLFGAGFDPGAFITFDLRLRWSKPGRPWAIGLRAAATSTLGMKGHSHSMADYNSNYPYGYGSTSSHDADGMYAADVGFLFDMHGCWLTSGIGLTNYRSGSDSHFIPEMNFGLGYDIAVTRRVALRLHTSVSTLILSVRAQAGAGLVLRL